MLLTEPWQGRVDLIGIGFAALAGGGWAVYILLTQRVGDQFTGVTALSLTVPIAALVAALFGIPQAAGHLTLAAVAMAAGLAILLPVVPFALEMLALRRMNATAFGTLMALARQPVGQRAVFPARPLALDSHLCGADETARHPCGARAPALGA